MKMSPQDEATELKNKGNDAFKKQDYATALDFYSQAIELNDKEPSLYTNRAQAHIKLESYGYAVADADKAIALDSNNVKAYYRRATANTSILKHREALRDWKLVIKKAPDDANAKLRMTECERIIKRDAFLKAIEVEDAPSAAEGLDVEHMILENGYKGPDLKSGMTLEFIEDMIEKFKNGQKIAKKYAYQIILAVMDIVKKEPTMVEHDVEEGSEVTVCGDTHGGWKQNLL